MKDAQKIKERIIDLKSKVEGLLWESANPFITKDEIFEMVKEVRTLEWVLLNENEPF